MLDSCSKSRRSPLSRSLSKVLSKPLLILILTAFVVFGALPGYLAGGTWRWTALPTVTVLNELKHLRQHGITLPGWQTGAISEIDHHWIQQTLIAPDQTQAKLLLLPQKKSSAQPQVEWTDLNGFQGWKTDSESSLEFTVPSTTARVTAHYQRSWTPRQTYAVVQWYAWSGGGHYAPSRWFVVDRLAQWQNRRAAWVAVTVLFPIEPLDDIEKYREKVSTIAQTVQAALMSDVLQDRSHVP